MAKEKRGKELPDGKPRGRVKHSSSTRSQHTIPHSHARSPDIQPVDWEERYHALFDRSLQYAIIQDFEGNILDANEMVLKLLGYDREDILHLNIASLLSEDQLSKASAALQELKDTGMAKQVNEWRLRHKDGSFVDMLLSGALIYHEGKPDAILGVGINITEHKRAEEALRLSEQNFRDSIEKSPLGIRIVNGDGKALYVNKTLLDIYGYDSLEELEAVPRNQLYPPESYAEHKERVNKRKRREYVPSNYEISIVRKDGQVRRLSVSRGELLWDGEKQFQVVYQDITESKQAEEALRQSEERYRTILEEIDDGYFETDLAGNITFVNDAMIRRLGYSREEIIRMNYRALRPKEEAKAVFEAYNRMYKTGEPLRDFFTEIICKDGSHIFAETSAFPIRNEKGEIIGFRGIRRDITERKRAEEALRRSEERYRTILEEMEEGYYEVDLAGTFTFVNDAMSRILGYSRDELIGMNYKAYTPQEVIKTIFQAYNRVYRTGEPLKWYPMAEFRKDGTLILAEDSVLPLQNEKGEVIGFRGISRDVTEHKRAEEALEQSKERYRQLAENAGEAIFVVQDGVIKFMNPKGAELSGYSIDEMVSEPFVKFIHPNDVDMVVDRNARRLKGEVVPQIYDFRIIRKDGDIRWGELNAVPISWENRPAVLCFMSDITEPKKAEEALRQSEERYRAILEEMEDSYFEVDLGGHLTFINSAGCRHLGYSKEELIGMSYKGFTAEDYIKSLFQIYNEVYRTAMPNKGFHWKIIRKDGSAGFIDSSVSPLRNDKGEVIGFSGVGRDITERKKMEEQLILTDRLASIGQLASGLPMSLIIR